MTERKWPNSITHRVSLPFKEDKRRNPYRVFDNFERSQTSNYDEAVGGSLRGAIIFNEVVKTLRRRRLDIDIMANVEVKTIVCMGESNCWV